MSAIKPKNDIAAERLRAAVVYDAETGLFRWRARKGRPDLNGRVAGAKSRGGYIMFQLGKRKYSAHRLAWLYHFGEWPHGDIDHINGDRADNRIENLRDATRAMNAQNQRAAQRSNSTGLLGAHRDPHGNGFLAQIRVNGRLIRLGKFSTPEEAHECYMAAKKRLHPGCTI